LGCSWGTNCTDEELFYGTAESILDPLGGLRMAHIKKLTDKPRKLPWRAQVRRKGHNVMVKMFAAKAEAEHWTTEQSNAQ
jgi:hypothetical protein